MGVVRAPFYCNDYTNAWTKNTRDLIGGEKMNKRKKPSYKSGVSRGSKIVWTVVMTLLGLVMIIPFAWMLSAAMKKPIDVFSYPIKWDIDFDSLIYIQKITLIYKFTLTYAFINIA